MLSITIESTRDVCDVYNVHVPLSLSRARACPPSLTHKLAVGWWLQQGERDNVEDLQQRVRPRYPRPGSRVQCWCCAGINIFQWSDVRIQQ